MKSLPFDLDSTINKVTKGLIHRGHDVFMLLKDDLFLQSNKDYIPARYFDKVKNVGDLLNPFLIEQITGLKSYKCHGSLSRHVVGVGSIAHLAGRGSILWGCGIIQGSTLPVWRRLHSKRISALRGHLTLNEFRKAGFSLENIPLGDPGLLASIYCDKKIAYNRYKIGIVPHYVHKITTKKMLQNDDTIKVLDVSLSPFDFINDLLSCEYVLSSSLHGLILSDTFEIPNKWIAFESGPYGGDFKFNDYYSTTNHPHETALHFLQQQGELEAFCKMAIAHVSVKKYKYSLNQLLDSFPFDNLH